MTRDYGLCLWTFGELPFEEKCQLAHEIGVTGVEVEGDISQNPKVLQEMLLNYGLKALSVTPKNVDISSENEEIRKEAVHYFQELLDWTKELGAPRICLHGEVGKVRGCGNEEKDWARLVASTKAIMQKAERVEIDVVFEVLNRYENHQIVTAEEAVRLVSEVGSRRLTVLLDAYHMNIEESCPVEALKTAGEKLGVYHIADSNRQAVGKGHAELKKQVETLHKINYNGPIIMEMTASGPDPFTPVKNGDYLKIVAEYYKESLKKVNEWDSVAAPI